jgi:hypothetical protein
VKPDERLIADCLRAEDLIYMSDAHAEQPEWVWNCAAIGDQSYVYSSESPCAQI